MRYYLTGGIILAVIVVAVVAIIIFGGKEKNAGESIKIVFKNEAAKADIWILPETKENKATTTWGKATVPKDKSEQKIAVNKDEGTETFIFRAIDEEDMYYEANGIALEDGFTLVFKKGNGDLPYTVETVNSEGHTVKAYFVFAAKL